MGTALASREGRRSPLSPARRRRLLGPPISDGVDARTEVRKWIGLAGALTALLMALGIPATLELKGWVAAAFVYGPGPVIASTVTALRVFSIRNPDVRQYARRLEAARGRAAAALRKELAALGTGRVEVDEHVLDVRRAWLVTSGGDGVAWVLVGDDRAFVLGGALPSAQIELDAERIPRRWSIERLPRSGALLGVRASGPAVRLERVDRDPDLGHGECLVVGVEELPLHLAEVTVGVSCPYRA